MIERILNEIDFNYVVKRISQLNKDDPNYEEDYRTIIRNYIDIIYETIKNESIEVKVAVLDMIFNSHPSLSYMLLKKNDPELFEAQLVLEKIKGVEIEELKYHPNDAKAKITYMSFMLSTGLSDKSKKITDYSEKIYKLLTDYLKDKDYEEEVKKNEENIKSFAKGLKDVQSMMFSVLKKDHMPPRSMIINEIFNYDFIDEETLNDIYNNVLLNSQFLSSFDYSYIIDNNVETLISVKGLFRKCNSEFFEMITNQEMNEEVYPYLEEILKGIVETNKDDKVGLIWFFKELSNNISRNTKLKDYLEKLDLYQEYTSYDLNEQYDSSLSKLLNGESDVDDLIKYDLGKYDGLKNKYDELLDKFIKSEDRKYKETLIIPLVVGLIERLKEKYNLNFKTVFSTSLLNNNTLGSFNKEKNVLYVNPFLFENFKDMNYALVSTVNTVFHEVRHARQYQEINTSHELNYDNLLMSIDSILSESIATGYYKDNYEHISFERDARECAYVDTMTFFKNYKEMQEKVECEQVSKYRLSDYIRKENTFNLETYYGIIDIFVNRVNTYFISSKDEKSIQNEFIELLNKYPVIFEFFDLDQENLVIKPKSEVYFKRKIKEIEQIENEQIREEQLYSIKAFQFAKKVGIFIQEQENFMNLNDSNDGYDEKVLEEVEQGVGTGPKR